MFLLLLFSIIFMSSKILISFIFVSFVISSTKICLSDRWISLLVFEEFFSVTLFFIVGFVKSAV
jgi:hypothetical protein